MDAEQTREQYEIDRVIESNKLQLPKQSEPEKQIALTTEWKPFAREVAMIFERECKDEEIFIRPDGLLYLPQTFFRKRLNEAFGAGNWVLYKEKTWKESIPGNENVWVYYSGILHAYGQYISQAIGQAKYIPSNSKTSLADATESAKSDCITRVCKDLGIGGDLYNPEFCFLFKKKYCQQVTGFDYRGKPQTIWVKKISTGDFIIPDGFTISAQTETVKKTYSKIVDAEIQKDVPTEKEIIENGFEPPPETGAEVSEGQVIFDKLIQEDFWKAVHAVKEKDYSLKDRFIQVYGVWAEYNKETKQLIAVNKDKKFSK